MRRPATFAELRTTQPVLGLLFRVAAVVTYDACHAILGFSPSVRRIPPAIIEAPADAAWLCDDPLVVQRRADNPPETRDDFLGSPKAGQDDSHHE